MLLLLVSALNSYQSHDSPYYLWIRFHSAQSHVHQKVLTATLQENGVMRDPVNPVRFISVWDLTVVRKNYLIGLSEIRTQRPTTADFSLLRVSWAFDSIALVKTTRLQLLYIYISLTSHCFSTSCICRA